jgi:hypothetical protein
LLEDMNGPQVAPTGQPAVNTVPLSDDLRLLNALLTVIDEGEYLAYPPMREDERVRHQTGLVLLDAVRTNVQKLYRAENLRAIHDPKELPRLIARLSRAARPQNATS